MSEYVKIKFLWFYGVSVDDDDDNGKKSEMIAECAPLSIFIFLLMINAGQREWNLPHGSDVVTCTDSKDTEYIKSSVSSCRLDYIINVWMRCTSRSLYLYIQYDCVQNGMHKTVYMTIAKKKIERRHTNTHLDCNMRDITIEPNENGLCVCALCTVFGAISFLFWCNVSSFTAIFDLSRFIVSHFG